MVTGLRAEALVSFLRALVILHQCSVRGQLEEKEKPLLVVNSRVSVILKNNVNRLNKSCICVLN